MGALLAFLAQLTEPERLLIAVVGAALFMLAALLILPLFLRRSRRGRAPAAEARLAEHHTPPYLPAVPSSPTLVVESSGQVVPLTTLPIVLGRAPECAVVVDHPSVSSQHARLYRDPNFGLCIEDLGSLNGLAIDQRLTRRNLLHRDCRLTLGEVVVLFRAGAGQTAPAPR